tara:strand:+ start:89 stop:718 length:630 start_codon:yes stop_codon:yes gene_type:complete
MPTWPTNKAGTTHLDSGTDNPGSARADIKQNVDNVNDMIDTIVVDSPSNNQVLAYDSSDSRFENKDVSTLVSSAVSAVATIRTTDSSNTYTTTFTKISNLTEQTDPDGIVSISTGVITVGAGTYLIFLDCPNEIPSGSSNVTYSVRLRDTTNSATLKESSAVDDPDAEPWRDGFTTQTFSGSTNLEIQIKRSTSSASIAGTFGLALLKL